MLIKVADAAAMLGLNRNNVYQLIYRGVFPAGVAVKVGGAVRFNDARLKEWIDAGGEFADQREGKGRQGSGLSLAATA